MTGPTPDPVTPLNRVVENNNPNNSHSLQDQILNHMSSLEALIKQHNERAETPIVTPIRLTFHDDGDSGKGKDGSQSLRNGGDEDLKKSYKEGVPEVMQISAFMDNSKCPELARRFADRVPRTGWQAASLGSWEQTPKDGQLWIKGPLPVVRPSPGTRPKGHYTNDCYHLKRRLEATLESGKLNHLVKDVRQRENNRGRQHGNNYVDDISDNPLIIEAEVEGYWTEEQLIPIRKVELWVKFRGYGLFRKTMLKFTMVRVSSHYNIILGRTRMRELRAVSSTVRVMVKFPTLRGIATLIARTAPVYECRWSEKRVVKHDEEIEVKEPEEVEESGEERVLVNLTFPKQMVTIGAQFSANINMKLNPKKCSFNVGEGKFLGYMVTSEGIRANPKKTKAAADMQSPKTLKAVFNKQRPGIRSKGKANTHPVWAYNIIYVPRNAVKGQVLADFINEIPVGTKHFEICSLTDDENSKERTLCMDGASSLKGVRAGLLIDPSGTKYTYAIRLTFPSTNNKAEYEALLVGLRISRKMKVHALKAKVDSKLVAYQMNGESVASSEGMEKYSPRPFPSHSLGPLETKVSVLQYLGLHQKYTKGHAKCTPEQDLRCDSCQIHALVPRLLKTWLTSIMSQWLFYQWGLDILRPRPLPEGLSKLKFIIVAIDYFTKWMEAKSLAKT
uniref:RNase H type-1 domain-containing protein n=1 Tax=Tanacetum cinerariifolium TaxID=118510 RepID=A0A6L2NY56_TANCI|nr:hypothetical protein [Tanacetum cinerariifolium]